ncbi:MAG: putative DNA binding domain-containing protein [Tannerellaceae bacterium]|jgi:ATP-dependent DNA helicase RecG|nr:putative DNA binding domain-containing protein [Tannerellaceae bacterium]
MNIGRVQELLKKQEDIRLEFKKAKKELPNNLFESICSMLNRDGGDILLGVADNGTIVGVDEDKISTMVTNLTNLSNNKQKLDPPFILFPQKYEIDGQWIIHIQVPASSQVHKTGEFIYDRSNDGDFRLTQAQQIADIHNRKRNYYTEGIIYSALRFEDFKPELFEKARNLIKSNKSNHPWLALNDKQMLDIAGFRKRDFQSGHEGYTLAAALLFGKDEVIQQIIPHYKIDAMVRIENVERYDDREYIQTNLIDAYDMLMNFVEKHLPDRFYMKGDQRISLRTVIFREVTANILVHREYTNAYPCKFTIFSDRVETENANNSRGHFKINPTDFSPFPKNPTITKFFIQLGRAEELGSGVLNVSNFIKEYSGGGEAAFIEDDIFRIIVPITKMPSTTEATKIDSAENGAVNGVDGAVNLNDALNNIIDDAIEKGVIHNLSRAMRNGAIDTMRIIYTNKEGVKAKDIISQISKSPSSVDRYLSILHKIGLIKFDGSPKSGRYSVNQGSALRN